MKNKNAVLKALAQYQAIVQTETLISAAVLIILLFNNDNNELEIVLTKRAANLQTYAGDYSFPGGLRDLTDKDLYHTATREAEEELSLPPDSYQYISQLDDFMSHDGHLIRPFVVAMKKSDFEK